MSRRLSQRVVLLVVLGVVVGLLTTVPATGKPRFHPFSTRTLAQLSSAPVTRYYLSHPEMAPANLQPRLLAAAQVAKGRHSIAEAAAPSGDRFNRDGDGLPQNEESVTVCKKDPSIVLEGTNDYRGFYLDPEGNGTGWHFSDDGGASLTNEGFLPHVVLSDDTTRPSGGDPVDVCVNVDGVDTLYAGSLNYDPILFDTVTSAIGVYKSDPATLASCPGGADPSCWPTAVAVAESAPGHFLDKEWINVGDTGDGVHVWATYSDFDDTLPCCYADVMAVRCEADLSSCSSPIKIDGATDDDIQFSDVTIGADGRTYISYVQVIGEIEGTAETFVIKMRVGDAGCSDLSCFSDLHTVRTIDRPLPFGGFLQADDFRIASVPKNTVMTVDGSPRIFVVYDECEYRLFDTVCERPAVKLVYSDDDGVSWSDPIFLSKTGIARVDYFPTIVNDAKTHKLVAAWFTNRFDQFNNAQDIEMVTIDPSTLAITKRQRVTTDSFVPNEGEADPLLGGFFIGDYIEVAAYNGLAYIGYNMNIRLKPAFGLGVGVNQQDNYVTVVNS